MILWLIIWLKTLARWKSHLICFALQLQRWFGRRYGSYHADHRFGPSFPSRISRRSLTAFKLGLSRPALQLVESITPACTPTSPIPRFEPSSSIERVCNGWKKVFALQKKERQADGEQNFKIIKNIFLLSQNCFACWLFLLMFDDKNFPFQDNY